MRLIYLEAQGITVFGDRVFIDFAKLPTGLCAFVGRNGAGKTTLMELTGPLTLFLRSVYYECSFIDMVRADCRDAYSELAWEQGGHAYTLRISGDAKTRKTEALLAVDGERVAGPTLADVRTHLDQVLPGLPLFLASAFSAQRNTTSFFELSPSKRKDMLIETMQLGKLQVLSDAAKGHAEERVLEIEGLRAKADVATASAAALDEARGKLAELRPQVPALAEALAIIGEQFGKLQAQLDTVAEQRKAEAQRFAHAQETYDNVRAQRRRHEETVTELTATRDRMRTQVAGLDAKRAAATLVEDLRKGLIADESKRDAALAARTDAAQATARAEKRLNDLIAEARNLKSQRETAERMARAVKDVDVTRDICKVCPLTAEGMKGVTALKTTAATLESVTEDGKQARAAVEQAKQVEHDASAAFAAAQEAVQARQREIQKHVGATEGLREAEAAAGRLTAIEEQLAAMTGVELPELPPVPTLNMPDSAAIEAEHRTVGARVDEARRRHDDLRAQVSQLEGRIATYEEQLEALGAIAEQLAAAEADHATWVQLAKALGRDGIQALEIDAAGPLIQSIANELLVTCYGTRFALKFVTTEPKKGKGGGVKEVFECQIIDAQAGHAVSRGSGGEQVIIDEALRLALTIYSGIKSGREQRTLWRDESVGPLDPENAAAYVAMLRRAMQLGNFERCLLIAHTQEVWEGCDAQIFVADGAVRIAA